MRDVTPMIDALIEITMVLFGIACALPYLLLLDRLADREWYAY